MHILVVDDHVQFAENLALALDGSGHRVTGVVSPADLRLQLPGQQYGLALVDLDFSRELGAADATGLAALELLHDAGVPAALYTMETEENRALFLLAAFHFFRPLAVVDKHSPHGEILRLVDGVANDQVPAGEPTGVRYRTPAGLQPLMAQLIRSEQDLRMWQAVGTHIRRNDAAKAAYVGTRTFDKFLAHQDAVVTAVEAALAGQGHAAPPGPEETAEARGARLVRVHEFARLHRRFFHDPTLGQLIHRESR